MRGARWKSVITGADEELYDLDVDPHETHDVARDQPAVLVEMRQALQAWKTTYVASAAPPVPVPPDVEEALRALGYAP